MITDGITNYLINHCVTDSLMYLPKHYNVDKYTVISKDAGNARTLSL